MVRVRQKVLKYIENLKMFLKNEKFKSEDAYMKNKSNPFVKGKDGDHKEHDSFIDSLFKDTKKYDKSTYPNTYVWIERFHENRKKEKRKSNVIKAKKNG